MSLISFSSIITLLIIILLVYTIINPTIGYKNKIMIIIIIISITIILLMNVDLFNNNSLIKNVRDATKKIIVRQEDIQKTNSEYSISLWMYIDDWNYKFGERKNVLQRENEIKQFNPYIYLDPYKNNVHIEFYTKPMKDTSNNSIDNYKLAKEFCKDLSQNYQETTEDIICDLDKETNEIKPVKSVKDYVKCSKDTNDNYKYYCYDDTLVENNSNDCIPSDGKYNIILENIPIQKWSNITCCFGINHVDIYLNGKLIKTKTFDAIQYIDNFEDKDIILCSNGGFAGSISNVSYYNYIVDPQKAWYLYKEGFNPVILGSLFKKYNASVTFYQDSTEKSKFFIL